MCDPVAAEIHQENIDDLKATLTNVTNVPAQPNAEGQANIFRGVRNEATNSKLDLYGLPGPSSKAFWYRWTFRTVLEDRPASVLAFTRFWEVATFWELYSVLWCLIDHVCMGINLPLEAPTLNASDWNAPEYAPENMSREYSFFQPLFKVLGGDQLNYRGGANRIDRHPSVYFRSRTILNNFYDGPAITVPNLIPYSVLVAVLKKDPVKGITPVTKSVSMSEPAPPGGGSWVAVDPASRIGFRLNCQRACCLMYGQAAVLVGWKSLGGRWHTSTSSVAILPNTKGLVAISSAFFNASGDDTQELLPV